MKAQKDPQNIKVIYDELLSATGQAWLRALPSIMRFCFERWITPKLNQCGMKEEKLWLALISINPPDEVRVRLNNEVYLQIQEINRSTGEIRTVFKGQPTRQDILQKIIIPLRKQKATITLDRFSMAWAPLIAPAEREIILSAIEGGEPAREKTHIFLIRTGDQDWFVPLPNFYPLLAGFKPQLLRRCLFCGQPFYPDKYRPDQKFCSTKCRVKYHRKRKGGETERS